MLELVVLSSAEVSNSQTSSCLNLCKDRVGEQPGLLALAVVRAGVSLPGFSAWAARQGEVCAAQQQIELGGSKVAWEDSGISVGHVYCACRWP